jgi:hypothetical protein
VRTIGRDLRVRGAIPWKIHEARQVKGMAGFLVLLLLVSGCATARPTPSLASVTAADQQPALDHAACEQSARATEESGVYRAALAYGALGTGLIMLHTATLGATWGARTGSVAEGAWIGAAVGAGIGIIVGLVEGVGRARGARARYLASYEICLRERGQASQPA